MSDDWRFRLSTNELRSLFEAVMRAVEELEGGELSINADYFWSVPPGEAYDLERQPATLAVGQLSDSLQFLRDGVSEDRVIPYHAVWLAEILSAIGDAPR